MIKLTVESLTTSLQERFPDCVVEVGEGIPDNIGGLDATVQRVSRDGHRLACAIRITEGYIKAGEFPKDFEQKIRQMKVML